VVFGGVYKKVEGFAATVESSAVVVLSAGVGSAAQSGRQTLGSIFLASASGSGAFPTGAVYLSIPVPYTEHSAGSVPALELLSPRPLLQGSGNSDALENVVAAMLPNGALCFVLDQRALYALDKFSTAAVSPPNIIATSFGPAVAGRWVKRLPTP